MKASSLQPSCVPWSGDEELENASCKKTSIDEMQKQSLALSGLSFSELESQLVQNMHSSTKVLASLQRFVRNNLEVKRSANYKCKKTDNPDIILDVLDLHRDHEEIVVQCLKTLRILARKENKEQNTELASEGSNVLLNICFEARNVSSLSSTSCVPALVDLLSQHDNKQVLVAALGALHSISFKDVGKKMIVETNAIEKLCPLLKEKNKKVKKKAIGTIHNLSSELCVVQIINNLQQIPSIIDLLEDTNPSIASSAAGCLQNLSRDDRARDVIQKNEGPARLTNLIFSTDNTMGQVSSIGALVNILGPDAQQDEMKKKALKKILSMCLLVGQLKSLSSDVENMTLEFSSHLQHDDIS
ncbi:hypothetical protein FDP41_008904 [Naegleria fowleri]|uniref:Condensin complex subunit 1 C-terminal domain-containing protein n=1 Tax=Naegleria fowleri TaxID=5763 RepID=A0A6A5BF31_NAEFO|nr:uncharacterized protein FDP41_008904 [Naegleria fowleri]KAF0972655.1 hypothetical protein FDP41_008904 [Naegleria fowleri]